MKLAKLVVVIFAGYAVLGCVSFAAEKSVVQVLNNKDQYLGQELIVSGILVITPKQTAICENGSRDDCLNLEIPQRMAEDLKAKSGTMVGLKGSYEHHEFRDVDGETVFYPSRFAVSEVVN